MSVLFFFPSCSSLFFVVHHCCLALVSFVVGGFILYLLEIKKKRGYELVWIITNIVYILLQKIISVKIKKITINNFTILYISNININIK